MLNSISSYNANQSFGNAFFAKAAQGKFSKAQQTIVSEIATKLSRSADFETPSYIKMFKDIGENINDVYFVATPATQKGKEGISISTLTCDITDKIFNPNAPFTWFDCGIKTFIPVNGKGTMARVRAFLKNIQQHTRSMNPYEPDTAKVLAFSKKPMGTCINDPFFNKPQIAMPESPVKLVNSGEM